MKKHKLLVVALITSTMMFSQEAITVTGGQATGSGGTSSYSVGQLVYSTNTGSNGSVAQGIQAAFEVITLSNPEFTALTLTAVTYPNPTTDYIVLALKNSNLTDLSYAMYDLQGRLVHKGKVNEDTTQVPMQHLEGAVYLLKVNQNNQELKTFKIIKK